MVWGNVIILLVFYHNIDCGTNADVAYIVTKQFALRTAATDTTSNGDTLNVLKSDTNIFKSMRVTPNPTKINNVVMVKNQIKVFPNPAQDYVRIVNENGMPIDKCSLYDLLGKA